MFDYPAKIEYKSFLPGRRILVISDIHGNLPFLIALLKKVGCQIVQGYYFSRPMPVAEYEAYLREHETEDLHRIICEIKEKEQLL